MVRLSVLLILLLNSVWLFATDFKGNWEGRLTLPPIRVVFHITASVDTLSATMDSPDQGAFGIPMNQVSVSGDTVRLDCAMLKLVYEGVLRKDTISGEFRQGSFAMPLVLSRQVESEAILRPQEPRPPYPYRVEEVRFTNEEDGFDLAGTLTMPSAGEDFPAVILITGSGPQNRDEELMGHKPFLLLADRLTRSGIAVLRFDDRGVGASGGTFQDATTFDFVKDAQAAFRYLTARNEIDPKKIGMLGHSEGASVAAVAASENPDVAFVVSLAGIGMPGYEVLLLQQKAFMDAYGMSQAEQQPMLELTQACFEIIRTEPDAEKIKHQLVPLFENAWENLPEASRVEIPKEKYVTEGLIQTASPWMIAFINFQPDRFLSRIRCPFLALNGEKDLQVVSAPNLEGIRQDLIRGGNNAFQIKSYPGLNHLFQNCDTGLVSEYATISETISLEVIDDIILWIGSN